MGTLIIKNVDLVQLEMDRHSTNSLIDAMPILATSEPLMRIVTMLNTRSNGSIKNQKAKKRQLKLNFDQQVYQCHICGYQGASGSCDRCHGHMEPTENVK
jgi:hypothetical protein